MGEIRAEWLAVLSVGGLALAASAPLSARAEPPPDFACGKPVMGFGEDPKLSRYTIKVQERVFVVRVYLGGAAGADGISVAPHRNGVCRLRLPVGDYLIYPVTWREANATARDKPLYQSLQVQYAGGSRRNAEWLLLRQTNPNATGITTLEFHVIYDQLSAVQN